MLTDNRLRSIDDYLSAADVFPGVGLKGGVCSSSFWDRDNPGQCRVTTHFKDWTPRRQFANFLSRVRMFICFNQGLSILRKVVEKERSKATHKTGSVAVPCGT